jgi:S-(hydroxymethyl)glutathione dehydrogenase/alcohol dehydrogenase
MIKIKSAILEESNKPLVIDYITPINELQFGQVLVDVHYSGICGAQINEIDAVKGPDKFLPHLLGHEGSGVVKTVGEGVSTVEVGDHVVMHWKPGSGLQSNTPKYKWNNKEVNAGWVTTFNEQAIVSENRLTVIPKEFNMKVAPLFGCAVTTAFGVINNDAKVKVGQSVLIIGIGGVGLNIAQAASMVSAYPIVGVDVIESKLIMGENFGLTNSLLATTENLNDHILEIVGKHGADVVIDTTGNSKVIEQAYNLTHPDGRTILVGVPNSNVSIYTLPLHFKKVLKGSHGGNAMPDIEIPRLMKLINANKMSLDKLITHEFDLDEINKALMLFRSGEAGRIIIKMNQSNIN